jgi:3-oxoacyl-[acyl-carrier-protein] synthase II
MIEDGMIERCIVGASDASIDPLMIAGYRRLGVYADDMIRPFDKRRNGFLIGEGAGILLLEEEEIARKRNARMYGFIDGYKEGQETGGALRFVDQNNTLSALLSRMCRESCLSDVDYINLHATGTRAGDRYESDQIKEAFGAKSKTISLSSTKSFTGHLLGASGAVEAGFCLLAMKENFVPPTVTLEQSDPDCDLNYTPRQAKQRNIQRAFSISMGFGGHIAILSFKKETR